MSVDIYCNGNFYSINNIPCYKDEIVFKTNIECEKERNKIILLIVNPRTNIDSMLYCSEFFFNSDIHDESYGQMESKILIGYNMTTKMDNNTFGKIYFLTKGTKIVRVTIEMPPQNRVFLRELIYRKKEMFSAYCCICYEMKSNVINLHNTHQFCFDCILQLENKKCPICRVDIE